uniref:Uncharacterized protein n=1 Tax=Anguilla anguilla TaxID=7936 RepID=A0A0E9R8B5_ANGAN
MYYQCCPRLATATTLQLNNRLQLNSKYLNWNARDQCSSNVSYWSQ